MCPQAACGSASCSPPDETCGDQCAAMYSPSNPENRSKFYAASCTNVTLPCLCETPGSVDAPYLWARESLTNITTCPPTTFPFYSILSEKQLALQALSFLSYVLFFVVYFFLSCVSCVKPPRDAEINPHPREDNKEQSSANRMRQLTTMRRPSNAARILAALSKHQTVSENAWDESGLQGDKRLAVPFIGTKSLFFLQGWNKLDGILRFYFRNAVMFTLVQWFPMYLHFAIAFKNDYNYWVSLSILPFSSIFYISHYLISRVLRESPKHLGKLLSPLAEGGEIG